MPLRTRLDSPHRDGETWDQVFDHRNPQRSTTAVSPGLVANNPSLRFMAHSIWPAGSCYALWRRLDESNVAQFGVTAYHDIAVGVRVARSPRLPIPVASSAVRRCCVDRNINDATLGRV